MSNVDILAFQLGQAASEPISREYQDFYLWVTRKILNLPHSLKATGSLRTTPISNEIIHKTPFSIYQILHERLNGLSASVSKLIIDLNNPPRQITRGALFFHFAFALRAWYDERASDAPSINTILLVPDLPPDEDDIRKQFEPLLNSGQLVIISESGVALPHKSDLDFDRFKFKQMEARGEPSELIQKKLIKRYGHFNRGPEGAQYCVPIFYDGRFCESETKPLFNDYIAQKLPDSISSPQPIIAYHGPLSPWVENAAIAVATERGLRSFNIGEPTEIEALYAIKPELIFLFLDMVDTGHTARALLTKLIEANPTVVVNSLAMMTTELDNKQEKTREITVREKPFSIQCVLKVEQEKIHNNCGMCKLHIPINNEFLTPDPSESLRISPFQMWSIGQKLGTEPEKDVPTYRTGLERVPRFSNFIRQNGAWIVDKFRQFADDRWAWVHDPLILYPDENGAAVLAEHIKLMLGWSAMQIPRRLINKFSDPDHCDLFAASDEAKAERTLIELKNTGQTDIVLLDVFNVSGKTLEGLYNLVVNVTYRKPIGCLLFMDFNPETIKPLQCDILSLYALQTNIETK